MRIKGRKISEDLSGDVILEVPEDEIKKSFGSLGDFVHQDELSLLAEISLTLKKILVLMESGSGIIKKENVRFSDSTYLLGDKPKKRGIPSRGTGR